MIQQRYGKRKDDYQILGSATPRHFAEAVSRAAKFRRVALLAD
jgi:hypothetical protein